MGKKIGNKYRKFKCKIDGIDNTVIVKKNEYVKVIPIDTLYKPSGIMVYFDNHYLHYDVYNEKGQKISDYHFSGHDSTPSVQISTGTSLFKITLDEESDENDNYGIEAVPLTETGTLNIFPSGNNYVDVETDVKASIIFVKNKKITDVSLVNNPSMDSLF